MRPVLQHTLVTSSKLETTLTCEEEKENFRHWRRRMRQPRSMLPKLYRDGTIPISDAEYRANNHAFDTWVNNYMNDEIEILGPKINRGEYCVHYSIGTGLGMAYIKKAKLAGLHPILYDWLPIAVRIGKEKLVKILGISPEYAILDAMVLQEEIEAASHSNSILPQLIRLTQASRIIEHQSPRKAASILEGLGRPLAYSGNRVVIIGAMLGKRNSLVKKQTSHNYSKPFHLRNLSRGAGRSVKIVRKQTFADLANEFTAITVEAK